MKELENLDPDEKSKLLKLPVYVSLLAANADGKMDEEEKKETMRLSHVKTFSPKKQLAEFYKEAEKVFAPNLEQIEKSLPKERKERGEVIKNELSALEPIMNKLDKNYAAALQESIKSYTMHVSKAHNTVIESFLIPFNIKGLTD